MGWFFLAPTTLTFVHCLECRSKSRSDPWWIIFVPQMLIVLLFIGLVLFLIHLMLLILIILLILLILFLMS